MDKELKEYLREGECILWRGAPLPFPLLDRTNKQATILRWIITVVLTTTLLVLYMAANATAEPAVIAILLLIAVVIILAPISDRSKLNKQRYFITNQRAITAVNRNSLYYMELDKIDDFEVISGLADHDCLVMGSSLLPTVRKQLRFSAIRPLTPEHSSSTGLQNMAIGLNFYCTEDITGAVMLLQQHTRSAAKKEA